MSLISKAFRFGPQYLADAAGNILNPGQLTGGVVNGTTFPLTYYYGLRIILTHVRIVNNTSGAATFSLYIGATGGSAGGTEFMGNATSVPANSAVDWYGRMPLDVADFLSGLASAGSALTIEGEGEIGVA